MPKAIRALNSNPLRQWDIHVMSVCTFVLCDVWCCHATGNNNVVYTHGMCVNVCIAIVLLSTGFGSKTNQNKVGVMNTDIITL